MSRQFIYHVNIHISKILPEKFGAKSIVLEKIPGKTVPDTATAQIIRIVTAVLYKKGVKWLFGIFWHNPKH